MAHLCDAAFVGFVSSFDSERVVFNVTTNGSPGYWLGCAQLIYFCLCDLALASYN